MTKEKFIAIISEEQESLRRFLLALCGGDRMEAEDIAQEAMIKAYIAIDRFVDRAKFATWLFKIAYNTFLDHQRSGWNRCEELDEAAQIPQWLFPAGTTIEALAAFPLLPKVILMLAVCFASLCITGLVYNLLGRDKAFS